MPPESISACGDCAAKVRKVLIRFHRRRRKLRNQGQRSYTSTLPEFESWRFRKHANFFASIQQNGRRRDRHGMPAGTWKQTSVFDAF